MTTTPAPLDRPIKVFYWPADTNSGVWEYRIRMQRDELLRTGHQVQASQTMSQWAREEADVIVGQRIAITGPAAMWMIIAQQERRPAMVYEVDDDLFSIEVHNNPSGAIFRQPNVRTNMIDCLAAADLVTVSTEPLAAVIRRWNRNVVVLPNCVRASTLDIPAPLRRGRDDGRVIFGWQGSPTHADDWAVARPAIGDLLTTDERAHLKMLGTQYFKDLPVLDDGRPGRLTFQSWTPDLNAHYTRVSRFDVSLAPLAPTVFNRSKSGLRAVESAALGVPIVASDVEAYRGWVEHGVTGFLVRTRAQWLQAMRDLMDPDLRMKMGAAARERARAWTIEGNISRWVDAYRLAMEAK